MRFALSILVKLASKIFKISLKKRGPKITENAKRFKKSEKESSKKTQAYRACLNNPDFISSKFHLDRVSTANSPFFTYD